MTLILKQLFQFIKLLNSDSDTSQLAWGIAMGFILGMTPFFAIQTIFVLLCIFLFRIQLGAALVSAFFFKFIAFALDPLFHSVGHSILNLDALRSLFIQMYNAPLVPFTRFNNTIVMGSFALSLALSPVLFILSKILISKYRATVVARFEKTKFWKAVKATSFYKWYAKYDQLYNI